VCHLGNKNPLSAVNFFRLGAARMRRADRIGHRTIPGAYLSSALVAQVEYERDQLLGLAASTIAVVKVTGARQAPRLGGAVGVPRSLSNCWVNMAAAKKATARNVSLPVLVRSSRSGLGRDEDAAGRPLQLLRVLFLGTHPKCHVEGAALRHDARVCRRPVTL
jgi:hypothetical protein